MNMNREEPSEYGWQRKSEGMDAHMHTLTHTGGPSCLQAADTNKGCWRFDSNAAGRRRTAGTAIHSLSNRPAARGTTKRCRMGDSQKRWQRHSDFKSQECRHVEKDTHTHPQQLCKGTAAGRPVFLSCWWDCMSSSFPSTSKTLLPAKRKKKASENQEMTIGTTCEHLFWI